MEKIDIYDENREYTGKTVIRNNGKIDLQKGEYIIGVKCWIVNDRKEVLLTQRRKDKLHGGTWEPTGGLVISGETSIEAIKRELGEEIGLDVEESKIQLIYKDKEDNFFKDVYIIRDDIPIDAIKFNDGEVIDAKYVAIDEFKQMFENGEINKWNESFLEIYKRL
jgi:mutator protein MutT